MIHRNRAGIWLRRRILPLAVLLCAGIAIAEKPTAFTPDAVFRGSSLTGWRTLGQGSFKAADGEITGSAAAGAGILLANKGIQDTGFFASFKCSGNCDTGILLRSTATPEGTKAIFISLKDGELGTYKAAWDPQGRETAREKLRPANGQIRLAPPPNPSANPGRAGGRGSQAAVKKGEWNTIQVTLDADIVRVTLNGLGIAGGATDDQSAGFGPVGLRVGSGDVQFKDVSYADLDLRTLPAEQVSQNFRMQRISDFYYSWSAAVADFNHDGVNDVVAGPNIYFGPDYTKFREIYLGSVVNASTEYPDESMMEYAYDFTGDGWPDVLVIGAISRPAYLFVNPKGEARRWDRFTVVPRVQKEIAVLRDIDGDGKPELVYGSDQFLQYAKPDPKNPTGEWIIHKISSQGFWGLGHGIGVGDINGDGRMDVVEAGTWWEQPADATKEWIRHDQSFGPGAEMGVYDVNGDGLADVVTSMNAHGYGLAWFEQKRDAAGKISFVEHQVLSDPNGQNAGGVLFSELHGAAVADVDGDNIPDFIVGKRFWSHKDDYTDPDPQGAPVLYWFRTVRNPKAPGGAELVPELIHNRSGAGNTVWAGDINGDGATDVLTSTDRGTFIFWGKVRPNQPGLKK
jgi:hypothetical protein